MEIEKKKRERERENCVSSPDVARRPFEKRNKKRGKSKNVICETVNPEIIKVDTGGVSEVTSVPA